MKCILLKACTDCECPFVCWKWGWI